MDNMENYFNMLYLLYKGIIFRIKRKKTFPHTHQFLNLTGKGVNNGTIRFLKKGV